MSERKEAATFTDRLREAGDFSNEEARLFRDNALRRAPRPCVADRAA